MSDNDNKKENTTTPVKKQEPRKKHNIPRPSKVTEVERETVITNLETYKEKK
ncbi:hypothetical protein L2737_06160 [Shewanella electrodiphila]|uniref:Uncharacterized protein n=1 Tax=Shewanella electrodiphila TaxID=934143 RepID=A0ABT0KM44_9GAMM|nr:hypothetical protein [Shewanella electrodiphila]MCL1044911.1 hypothetical protein [Shewanella electrodiphila]